MNSVTQIIERITNALSSLGITVKKTQIQMLRWKVYTMPWKRNSRKRQMMKVCTMMVRSLKKWEVF